MKIRFWVIPFLMLFLILGCDKDRDIFYVRILHINDTHSHIEPTLLKLRVDNSSYYIKSGGYSYLYNYFLNERKRDKNLLLLHAGDAVQGTIYFTLFGAEPDIKILNRFNIDFFCLGNHEFDKGADWLYKNFLKRVNFEIVDANIKSKNEKFNALIHDYAIKEFPNGEKVAVVGLSVDASKISQPGPTIEFLNIIQSSKKIINILKRENINKIIFLTHLGYDNDIFLASEVEGIDVIVGGHSHTLLGDFNRVGLNSEGDYPTVIEKNSSKTLIVTAWKWGMVVGDITLFFNDKGEIVNYYANPKLLASKEIYKKKDGRFIAVNDLEIFNKLKKGNVKFISSSKEIDEIINLYKTRLEEFQNEILGYSTKCYTNNRLPKIENNKVVFENSSLALVVADAIYEKFKNNGGCDIVIQNSGGIRSKIEEGNITLKQVYEVLPFENSLILFEIKGEDIKKILEDAIDISLIKKEITGAFPFLSGAKIEIDVSKTKGERIVSFKIKDKYGNYIDMKSDKIYKVIVNAYLAKGGDGYGFNNFLGFDSGFIDTNIFIDYIKKHGFI